jgi:hypothetical protein
LLTPISINKDRNPAISNLASAQIGSSYLYKVRISIINKKLNKPIAEDFEKKRIFSKMLRNFCDNDLFIEIRTFESEIGHSPQIKSKNKSMRSLYRLDCFC